MSYNFGNDGATQFQGGGYGYARVYVLFASFLSLSLSLHDVLCILSYLYKKERFWGKEIFEKKMFLKNVSLFFSRLRALVSLCVFANPREPSSGDGWRRSLSHALRGWSFFLFSHTVFLSSRARCLI
jgi:hypothetical protein